MNKLNVECQAQVIRVLCDGSSIRGTSRITGASINTVVKLLQQVGEACMKYQDLLIHDLTHKNIQCDEIWSFCYAKEKNVPEDKKRQFNRGNVWTFIAIYSETKLVASPYVKLRDPDCAYEFMSDLASRLANRVQDGHKVYLNAVENAFGADINHAILIIH